MLAALPAGDPLSWFALHPQLLLVVVGGALWLFKRISALTGAAPGGGPNGRRAGAAGEGPSGRAEATVRPPDDDEAERTRRVQAEVRRKIAERRGRPVAPPLVAPRPIAQPLSPPFGWPPARGTQPETVDASESQAEARADPFGRNDPVPTPAPGSWIERRTADQAAAAATPAPARRSVEPVAYALAPAPSPSERSLSADVVARNARVFAAATEASASAPAAPVGAALAAELREPNAARRAMLLREILGPPVGLR